MFKMLYPSQCMVTESQVRMFLADCIANDEVEETYLVVADAKTLPIEDVIKILQNTKYTFEVIN